ncbi:MAG: hypothetical protein EBX99_07090 [Acidimicrobiia bacterium]|nr:hypothetical protein [Acidimicrobiia bacterium]
MTEDLAIATLHDVNRRFVQTSNIAGAGERSEREARWAWVFFAGTFVVLILLSCMGRAALFALPAVIVPKRALVATVGVALVIEYLAGLIPAVVNQFTVSLRLRTLLVSWTGLRRDLPSEFQLLVDINHPWYQVSAVLVLTVVFLAIAWAILEWRQFPPSDES